MLQRSDEKSSFSFHHAAAAVIMLLSVRNCEVESTLCSNGGKEKPLLLNLLMLPEMCRCASSSSSKEAVFKVFH